MSARPRISRDEHRALRLLARQVAIRSKDAAAMTERLAARGVAVSWREDKVRAMFHAYNNGADIDALVEGLTANRDLLA
jgi:selenocysteine lyase/cysteine desulfurase